MFILLTNTDFDAIGIEHFKFLHEFKIMKKEFRFLQRKMLDSNYQGTKVRKSTKYFIL